jgi:hypothetical protein
MAEPARIPIPGPEAPLTGELLTGELLTGEPVSRDPLTIRIAPETTDPETLPVPGQLQSDPVNMSPDFDAEAADVPTGNDMIVDFGASRPPEGSSPETFSLIESMGYDADYVISKNIEIDATAKDKPPPITETTLADPNDKAGSLFIESAKILMPLFPDRFPGDDKDPAQWGLEFMGWFNFNLPSMGMSLHKIQSAPDNQKLALLYMMELYIEKDITWDGTKRALTAIVQDPTTYVGLGTFGFGAFLGASAKQATKAGVMSALRASLPATKLGALEGALYGGVQNIMEQKVKIEGGRQEELDLREAALVSGVGAFAAGGFTAGLGVTGKLAKDAVIGAIGRIRSRQASGGTPLRAKNASEAGLAPIISPKETAPSGGGSQLLPTQTSIMAPPSGVSEILASTPPKLRGAYKPSFDDIDIILSNKIYHFNNDLTTLLELANAHKALLKGDLDDIATEIPGIVAFKLGPRIKKKQSLLKKMKIKEIEPNQLSDLLGGRLVADNLDAIELVKARLNDGFSIIEIDDFHLRPKGGYRATHIQIMSDSGLSIEIQAQVKEIRAVQDGVHKKYYEPWKGKRIKIDSPEHKRMKIDHAKGEVIFNAAWNRYLKRTGGETLNNGG